MMISAANSIRLLSFALIAWWFAAHAGETSFASNAAAEKTIRSLLIASPYKISKRARAGTIRYTFETAGTTWRWPETGEQHVRMDGNLATLTICNDCGWETAPSADELSHYLAPNEWVNSNDRAVRAFARKAGGGSIDSRMSALVHAVQTHMNGPIDFQRYETASEALVSRGGDCTEFAVLLAAAARARGIPARVVAGLAYDSHFLGKPHTFGPHMWVQVWDGERWRSYDAALAQFDAGHIALAAGDGNPQQFGSAMALIARLRLVEAVGLLPESADTVTGQAEPVR
jgi:transglutaminase-like putative cysteine protease